MKTHSILKTASSRFSIRPLDHLARSLCTVTCAILALAATSSVSSSAHASTLCPDWNSGQTYNPGALITYQGVYYVANRYVYQSTPPIASDNEWFWTPISICEPQPGVEPQPLWRLTDAGDVVPYDTFSGTVGIGTQTPDPDSLVDIRGRATVSAENLVGDASFLSFKASTGSAEVAVEWGGTADQDLRFRHSDRDMLILQPEGITMARGQLRSFPSSGDGQLRLSTGTSAAPGASESYYLTNDIIRPFVSALVIARDPNRPEVVIDGGTVTFNHLDSGSAPVPGMITNGQSTIFNTIWASGAAPEPGVTIHNGTVAFGARPAGAAALDLTQSGHDDDVELINIGGGSTARFQFVGDFDGSSSDEILRIKSNDSSGELHSAIMTWEADGQVGIGIDNPSQDLHIQDEERVEIRLETTEDDDTTTRITFRGQDESARIINEDDTFMVERTDAGRIIMYDDGSMCLGASCSRDK